jgi:hypothetical protein
MFFNLVTRNRLLALMLAVSGHAFAVTGVNPNGVNVNSSGVTTVFLTFQNLGPNESSVEALWCGDVTTVAPSPVNPCVPGTIFGTLPLRSDLSRASGTGGVGNLTDIMTIPASVARRAYQAAQAGEASDFFYVRRFSDGVSDTYVTVTCRMAGGGARVPLALTAVNVYFDAPEGERAVYFIDREAQLPPWQAQISYNGAGRLQGRWEIVQPGDTEPSTEDLLTEATLPVEQRGSQRRYALIERFDVFLPPAGKFLLAGPDPGKVPALIDGPYKILLRIEASADKEGNSNTLDGLAISGGVAGFPMPVLRFFRGTPEAFAAAQEALTGGTLPLLLPGAGVALPAGMPVTLSWLTDTRAAIYRVQIRSSGGELLSAIVPASSDSYVSPPWVLKSGEVDVSWRVVALDGDGRTVASSEWRSITVE